ncbi:MAG: DNA alkylation repair protein [Candidatus Sericytochromatia bacterium]
MEFEAVMQALEEAGTEQARKTYARHGAGPCHGVSFAKLGELKKKIKKDQALAERLWATGFAEARALATMVADPALVTPALLDAWAQDADNFTAGQVADLAARTAHARELLTRWTASDDEWIGKAAWMLVAKVAMEDPALTDDEAEALLARIESEIGAAPNMVKDAMNNAIIAIGIRNERLEGRAIATARRIGPVVVDHGQTNCKTPAAEPYILKARARKQAQAEQKAAKR